MKHVLPKRYASQKVTVELEMFTNMDLRPLIGRKTIGSITVGRTTLSGIAFVKDATQPVITDAISIPEIQSNLSHETDGVESEGAEEAEVITEVDPGEEVVVTSDEPESDGGDDDANTD